MTNNIKAAFASLDLNKGSGYLNSLERGYLKPYNILYTIFDRHLYFPECLFFIVKICLPPTYLLGIDDENTIGCVYKYRSVPNKCL